MALLFALSFIGWLVFGAFVVCCIFASEIEFPEVPLIFILLVIAGLWFFNGYNPLPDLWNNRWWAIADVIGYVALGIGWSIFRFGRYSKAKRKEYEERKASWGKNSYQIKIEDYQPKALQCKRKFYTWIVLWWASAIWYVIQDALREFIDFVVEQIAWIADKVGAVHWKDAKDDLPPADADDKPTQLQSKPWTI
jgi:hypothetical protein